MTFSTEKDAFVWIWLPGETEPVVAGRLEADNGNIMFNYGKSYLERIGGSKPAIAIYEPELPLRAGLLPLPEGLTIPGCIRDAAPDAWGRRVIINKKLGIKGTSTDTADLNELTYLLDWDGKALTMTPAYDICPQGRTGNMASQAMLISGNNNLSQLRTCLETAHNFLLSEEEAREIFRALTAVIEQNWDEVCTKAELNEVDKKLLWKRQFLNPYSVEQ